MYTLFKILSTLRTQTFAGTNFRGFADFGQNRESLCREKILIRLIRESLFPRNSIFFQIRQNLHKNKEI